MRRTYRKAQRGSVLILLVMSLVMLLGIVALAIDVSLMYAGKRRAQSVADAAAFAGAPFLPATSNATLVAQQVITANNATSGAATFTTTAITFSSSTSTVKCDDGTSKTPGAGNAMTVTGYVNVPLTFAAVIGYKPTSTDGKANTKSVSATATVLTENICTLQIGVGLAPFGVVADDPTNSDPSVAYMSTLLTTAQNSNTPLPNTYQPVSKQIPLKASSWKQGTLQTGGNFGALALTGNGASAYGNAIANPTSQTFYVGETISTKPGNTVGPTDSGVASRLDAANTAFTHNYADYPSWFFGKSSFPIDTTLPPVIDGSTTYYYHQDPHRQELTDARVVFIPLIDHPAKSGRSDTTILAFATFFIDSAVSGQVNGRFVGVIAPQSVSGGCTGGGVLTGAHMVR